MRVLACLATLLAATTAAAQESGLAAVPGFDAAQRRLANEDRISVIAQLRPSAGDVIRMSANDIREATTALARDLAAAGIADVRPLGTLPFVVVEVDRLQLEALARSGLVSTIEINERVVKFLAQTTPLVGAPSAWSGGFRGAGQVVAIVDDGIERGHEFLTGRVVDELCTASDCSNGITPATGTGSAAPCAGCTHGTHVAGIAAGRKQGGAPANGVAPDAGIVAARVFAGPITTTDRIVLALAYIPIRSRPVTRSRP